MAYKTINPYTNEEVKSFPYATDAEVAAAIDKADKAFHQWKKVPIAERVKILQKAADLLRRDIDEHAKLMTLEMGKLFREAKSEVEFSATIFEYYAANAEKFLAREKLTVANPQADEAYVEKHPLGVLLIVEPWNFPYSQVVRVLAPQLAAGNTVLLKHASNVPQSAARLDAMMLEAGLPEGCFHNLFPTHEQVDAIIQHPHVKGVALTGSEAAGSIIASAAGKALKKSTMELGGSDAFIVCKDADLDKTVDCAIIGRHRNAGQVCIASKRMIIADEVYDEFVEKYKAKVAELVPGDPMDSKTKLAPLSSQSAADNLKKQVEDAVKQGAKKEVIGAPVPEKGAFFQAVMLTGMTKENPARLWEFFGPVSMLFRFKTEEEAIEIANDTPYGLGGSIFTKDTKRGYKLAQQVKTGMCFINHPTKAQAALPFGGVDRSGYGRELTGLGINEFVNHKLLDIVDIDAPF